MAFYVDKDLGQGTVTCKDYDLYCHFGKYVTLRTTHLHTKYKAVSHYLKRYLLPILMMYMLLLLCDAVISGWSGG